MNFTNINIENFRGIRKCVLSGLGLVNVFFGKNNCGKSSVLESIFLMCGPSNPTLPIVVNNMRNLMSFSEEDLRTEFYGLNPENEILITGSGNQKRKVNIGMIASHSKQVQLDRLTQQNADQAGKHYGFKINFSVGEDGRTHHTELIVGDANNGKATTDKLYEESLYAEYIPSGYMMLNVNEKLAQVIKNKRENDILEALRLVEPRIKDIQLLDKKIMVDIGLDERLPINVLGDGVRKVLSILLSIHNAQNGVLLVDEIDNGLHYSVMPNLWNVILHSCKKLNTQLFVSTHSMDMVKALVSAISEIDAEDNDVSAFKLIKKNDDEIAALRYGINELSYSIEQELEVR